MMIDNMTDFLAHCITSRTTKMPIFYNKFKIEKEFNIKDIKDYNIWFTCYIDSIDSSTIIRKFNDMIDIDMDITNNTLMNIPELIYNKAIIIHDINWKIRYRIINDFKQYTQENQAISNISHHLSKLDNNIFLQFLKLYQNNPDYNHKVFSNILFQMEKEGVFNV